MFLVKNQVRSILKHTLNQGTLVFRNQGNSNLNIQTQVFVKAVKRLKKVLLWRSHMLHLQAPLRLINQTILGKAALERLLGQTALRRLKKKIKRVKRTLLTGTKSTLRILHPKAFKARRPSKTVFVQDKLWPKRQTIQRHLKQMILKKVRILKHLTRQVWVRVRVP